jgi:hypothetical protein
VNPIITWLSEQHISSWPSATWTEYLDRLTHPVSDQEQVFLDFNTIWVDMGNKGINHARFNELFTLIFGFWFAHQADISFDLLA